METITIYIGGTAHRIPYEAPRTLSAFLEPYGFPMPCGGAHTCGKCKVAAYGALSPLSEAEKRLLTADEQLSNVRLACCAQALGGCTVHARAPENARIETAGLSAQRSDASPFGTDGYALAVDIGTTTVAAYLVNLTHAQPMETASALNAQAPYGADVIARIARCAECGIRPLQEAILTQLDGLFTALLKRRGLDARVVRGVVLTGNTTMLHLAAGLDPAGIAAAPYTPQSLFGVMESARSLFAALPPDAPVYFAPCAGAYIGGDLICALLAAAPQENELLMDVGTNGELALITGTGILCCSTAAGPAFEGAGLSHGMVAADGAITDVSITERGAVCAVAGGGRYDNMVGKFLGTQVPAVGFSIGFERVCGILLEQGYQIPGAKQKIALLYGKDADFTAVLSRAAALRDAYNVTVLPQGKKLGKQLGQLEAAGFAGAAFMDKDEVKVFAAQ